MLSLFFSEYLKWSSGNKKEWEQDLLADIKQLLLNLQAVLTYIEVLRWDATMSGKNSAYKWVLFDFGAITEPLFLLKEGEKEVLRLVMVGKEMRGELVLSPEEGENPLVLRMSTTKIVAPQSLVEIGNLIYRLTGQLKSLYEKHGEMLRTGCVIFARILELNWLPEGGEALLEVERDGLWVGVEVEGGALLLV